MTVVAVQPPALSRQQRLEAERENARALYRQSLIDGHPLTGPQLAELVANRTPRWCTNRINEVHAERCYVPAVPEPAPAEVSPSESESPEPVSPWLRHAAVLLVLLVFCTAAATSYMHQRTFAERAGEHLSGLLPLTVDALVFAALLSMHVFRKLDQPTPGSVTGCLWIGIIASIGANVANVLGTTPRHPIEATATAVWPPLVAFLTHEMVTKLLDALGAARKAVT